MGGEKAIIKDGSGGVVVVRDRAGDHCQGQLRGVRGRIRGS